MKQSRRGTAGLPTATRMFIFKKDMKRKPASLRSGKAGGCDISNLRISGSV